MRVQPPLQDVGSDPDYRFSLANERTFLAWIRTALALDAGGLAVVQLLPPFAVPGAREALGMALVLLGTLVAGTSYQRWKSHERAMREKRSLPASRVPILLAIGVCLVSVVAVVLLIVSIS